MIPFELKPTTGFEVAVYPPGATYGPRYLATYEFVWMIEGDALYRRDNVTVQAPAGSVVLCRPGAHDSFRWDPDRRTRHGFFHFHLCGSLPREWPAPETWPTVRLPGSDSDLLPIIFRHLLSNVRDATQARLLLATLLAAFVTGDTVPTTDLDRGVFVSESLPEPIRRALVDIHRRLDDDGAAALTLDELALSAFVTPAYLCRLFKSSTGSTPLATVRTIRLVHARKLLQRTNYNVSEVASICGFESPFHFSRAFKAQFGQSPRELRGKKIM